MQPCRAPSSRTYPLSDQRHKQLGSCGIVTAPIPGIAVEERSSARPTQRACFLLGAEVMGHHICTFRRNVFLELCILLLPPKADSLVREQHSTCPEWGPLSIFSEHLDSIFNSSFSLTSIFLPCNCGHQFVFHYRGGKPGPALP